MNIQEGDFTEENLRKSIEVTEGLIRNMMSDVINTYGGEAADNIAKGTLCKFVTRLNILLINIKLLRQFVDVPSRVFEMANSFTYTEKEISKNLFIVSRFDFFVGIFSLFEDAVSNGLAVHLLSEDELKRMELSPEYKKIFEDAEIKKIVDTKYPKIYKEFSGTMSFVPFDSIIRKLRKKDIITDTQESFLLSCKIVRNSKHNNGFHRSSKQATLSMLGEEFTIDAQTPPTFITLGRMIAWAQEIINLFCLIVAKTDWKNIRDISTI